MLLFEFTGSAARVSRFVLPRNLSGCDANLDPLAHTTRI